MVECNVTVVGAKKRCAYTGLTLSPVAKSKLKYADDFMGTIKVGGGVASNQLAHNLICGKYRC